MNALVNQWIKSDQVSLFVCEEELNLKAEFIYKINILHNKNYDIYRSYL